MLSGRDIALYGAVDEHLYAQLIARCGLDAALFTVGDARCEHAIDNVGKT
jgi:hypothetical protein